MKNALTQQTDDPLNKLFGKYKSEEIKAKTDKGADSVLYRCISDIEAKPIRWLWPGCIARGKVSMIAGNPGLGKSQVTASMAAIVSTGGQWPVDRAPCDRGTVVILSAEDDPADTIRPRLEAAGADLSRVYVIDAIQESTKDGERQRTFNLSVDLPRLSALLKDLGNVALIVIDPITAYLGDTDSHKNAEVRALLAPLSKLAEEHRSAVVCVSHLNKGGASSEALMRVTGSLAFVAAARAAFIVARDPQNARRRIFLPAKNNIGNDQTGFAFSIESILLQGDITTSRIRWEAEAVTDMTADQALAPDLPGESTERNAAVEWLRDLLEDGPMSAKEVKSHADQAGLAWRTVRRAKDELGIKPAKTRFDGGWEWALPKMSTMSTPENVDTFGHGGHLGEITEKNTGSENDLPTKDAEGVHS